MNLTRCCLAGLLILLAPVPGRAGELYDLQTGRELAIGGGALTAGLLVWQRASRVQPLSTEDLAALDPADVPAFDRIATRCWSPGAAHLSDLLSTGLTLAPLALLADTGPDLSGGELLVMYLESLAISRSVTGSLKLGVGRARPLAYNPDPRIPDEHEFFRFELAGADDAHRVRWFVNGEAADTTTGPTYAWRLARGTFTAFAEIDSTDGTTPARTATVTFQVQ